MSFNIYFVGQFAQLLGQHGKQLAPIVWFRAATTEISHDLPVRCACAQ
jgi:hypothetical protein